MQQAQRLSYLPIFLAALLLIPFMGTGFKMDDFMYLNQAVDNNESGDLSEVLKMWDLTGSDEFSDFKAMWWANPDFQINFLRPSAALLFHFNHRVFGDNAAAYYVIPLCLVIALMLVWRHFCQTLLPPAAALLTLFIVASHHALADAFFWISNNHHAFAPTLIAWCSILCYVKWRKTDYSPALMGHVVLAGISLAIGEVALCTLCSLYFYEFFVLNSRWRALVQPLAALTTLLVAYVLFYKFMGYGVQGSGMYINPFGDLAALTTELPKRLTLSLASLWGKGAYTPSIYPRLYYALAGLGALCLWFRFVYQHITREQRGILLYCTLSTVVAIGPGLLAFPSDRVLFPALIFAAMSMALLIVHSYTLIKAMDSIAGKATLAVVMITALMLHLIYQPAYTLLKLREQIHIHAVLTDRVSKSFTSSELENQNIVFLNASPSLYAFYGSNIARYEGTPFPAHKSYLTACKNPLRFERKDEHTLRLQVGKQRHLFSCSFARMVTSKHYLQKHDSFETEFYTATIIARSSDGYPSVVNFRFHQSLDDNALEFRVFKKGKLEHAHFTNEGDTVLLYQGKSSAVSAPPTGSTASVGEHHANLNQGEQDTHIAPPLK